MLCKKDVKCNVPDSPHNAAYIVMSKLFKGIPRRNIFSESIFNVDLSPVDPVVNRSGIPHEFKHVFRIFWRMGIIFRIGKGVVHPVQHGIGFSTQITASLGDPGENKEETLPKCIHGKHHMRSIAMQKEGLGKSGQIPMCKKKSYNYPHRNKFKKWPNDFMFLR